jgi:hypothetical protein
MHYEDLYNETIAKLKRLERPLITLTPELISELKSEWEKIIAVEGTHLSESKALEKILCILDNTRNMSREFNDCFFKTMASLPDGDVLIYALAASQKHVVNEALKSGVMIQGQYFDLLKKFLKSKNPEVLEWTLRTIESMGPMSLRFQKEIRALKPSMLKIFNQHQRAAFQIVDLLEKNWEAMKL